MGALAALASCDPSGQTQCDPACDNGLVCDTTSGECVVPRLERFEGTAPGRSVRLGVVGEQAFLAAINPHAESDEGNLLVGTAGSEEPKLYVLTRLSRPLGRKLALATSRSTVAVAWLDQDNHYRVAVHAISDGIDRWRILAPIIPAGQDYRGSEHFDIALDTAGGLQVAYRDAHTQSLHFLSGSISAEDWQLSVVDDPAEQSDTSACSEQQRRLSGRGIGYYPDISSRAGTTFIAYQDGDCGDLRLASRLDDGWSVTLIDTGDFEREEDMALSRGATGKFPSIAVDSAGNLAIAYQDASRGQLLIAYDQDGRFVTEVVDPGFEVDAFSRKRKHLVGGFASLVFDNDDIPWIAYVDSTTSLIRLAHRTRDLDRDGTWSQETVDARPPTGFSTSLGFSSALGKVIATEHLRPTSDGISSQLDFLEEAKF